MPARSSAGRRGSSPVQVDGDAGLIGSIGRVTITAAGPNSLFGRLAEPCDGACAAAMAEAAA